MFNNIIDTPLQEGMVIYSNSDFIGPGYTKRTPGDIGNMVAYVKSTTPTSSAATGDVLPVGAITSKYSLLEVPPAGYIEIPMYHELIIDITTAPELNRNLNTVTDPVLVGYLPKKQHIKVFSSGKQHNVVSHVVAKKIFTKTTIDIGYDSYIYAIGSSGGVTGLAATKITPSPANSYIEVFHYQPAGSTLISKYTFRAEGVFRMLFHNNGGTLYFIYLYGGAPLKVYELTYSVAKPVSVNIPMDTDVVSLTSTVTDMYMAMSSNGRVDLAIFRFIGNSFILMQTVPLTFIHDIATNFNGTDTWVGVALGTMGLKIYKLVGGTFSLVQEMTIESQDVAICSNGTDTYLTAGKGVFKVYKLTGGVFVLMQTLASRFIQSGVIGFSQTGVSMVYNNDLTYLMLSVSYTTPVYYLDTNTGLFVLLQEISTRGSQSGTLHYNGSDTFVVINNIIPYAPSVYKLT